MPKIYEIINVAGLDSSDTAEVTEILKDSREYGRSFRSGITGTSVDGDLDSIAQFVVKKLQEKEEKEHYINTSDEHVEAYKAGLDAKKIQAEKEAEAERLEREREKLIASSAAFMTTTGESFEGYKIVVYGGCISSDAVTAVQRQLTHFSNIGIEKGKTRTAVKLVNSIQSLRQEALAELKAEAANCNCNAVVGVSYNYITLDPLANPYGATGNSQPYIFCVSATGTAVRIEKEESVSHDYE